MLESLVDVGVYLPRAPCPRAACSPSDAGWLTPGTQ